MQNYPQKRRCQHLRFFVSKKNLRETSISLENLHNFIFLPSYIKPIVYHQKIQNNEENIIISIDLICKHIRKYGAKRTEIDTRHDYLCVCGNHG